MTIQALNNTEATVDWLFSIGEGGGLPAIDAAAVLLAEQLQGPGQQEGAALRQRVEEYPVLRLRNRHQRRSLQGAGRAEVLADGRRWAPGGSPVARRSPGG